MKKVFEYGVFLLVVVYDFPTYGQRCRVRLTETTGRIVSPAFPDNYPSYLNCSWTIEASQSHGLVVEITIEEFDLEESKSCSNDFLAVYDGPTDDSPVLLPPSCGSKISWPVYPSKLLTTGRMMTIVFVSDGAISAGGFRAHFNQVPPREDFILAVDVKNRQIYKQDRFGVGFEALPVVDLQNPVAVDFDPIDRKVYFTDAESDFIGRINIDGTDQETLVSSLIGVPDGMAVDYVSRIMYWTDTGTDTISVATLDGKLRRILQDTHLDEPRDIVVHQNQGYIYWSDWGYFPKIEKSKGDGSDRTLIVTKGLGWPNGLALDGGESKLYWADAKFNRIERINLDGSQRELLKAFDTDIHPFGLVLIDNGIFWTDWITWGIDAVDSSFEEEPSTFLLNGQPGKLLDLVHHTSSVPSFPERDCSYGRLNSGCNELCVLIPTGSACLNALPVFENCPENVFIWTSEITVVTWMEPSAWSPSGVYVTVTSSHGNANSITLTPSDDVLQITYLAMDEFGNNANCSFLISVAYDNIPPTVSMCPEDISKEISSLHNGTTVFWEEPQAIDNSGNVSLIRRTHHSGSRFYLGETEVVYVWQDGEGNTVECNFRIIITADDTIPPTVSMCPEDISKEISSLHNGTTVLWEEPQAIDNSGNVSLIRRTHHSGSRFHLGETKVVYVWQDGEGNTADCNFQITITTDTESKSLFPGGGLTTIAMILIAITASALVVLLVATLAGFTFGKCVKCCCTSSGNESTPESNIYLTPMNVGKGKRDMCTPSLPHYTVQQSRLSPQQLYANSSTLGTRESIFYHEIKSDSPYYNL